MAGPAFLCSIACSPLPFSEGSPKWLQSDGWKHALDSSFTHCISTCSLRGIRKMEQQAGSAFLHKTPSLLSPLYCTFLLACSDRAAFLGRLASVRQMLLAYIQHPSRRGFLYSRLLFCDTIGGNSQVACSLRPEGVYYSSPGTGQREMERVQSGPCGPRALFLWPESCLEWVWLYRSRK